MKILEEYVGAFDSGRDLGAADAETFLDALIGETSEEVLDRLFRAWNHKGISAEEIYEIAYLMRGRCIPVTSSHDKFVDIVGTGGSRNKTFNVSTAAAFVIAGSGVAVAKHGNRAATSNSGSADVLSALGVEPAVEPATAERCLNELGMCFMFAPNFHRLSPTLAKVRRGLGFPTIFNCVGPLCNPANAPHRLIGVWKDEFVSKTAATLARLGTARSWIVHGRDGSDEISLGGPTLVAEVTGNLVREYEITPESFGLRAEASDRLRVDSPVASGDLILGILNGDHRDSAAERLVLINAASGIFLAGGAESLGDCVEVATESIRSGAAISKLEQLRTATNT